MNGMPNRQTIERMRARYQAGTRVRLIQMDDPYNKSLAPGAEGTVVFVDDTGTVHVQWDCGSTLGAVYGVDRIAEI